MALLKTIPSEYGVDTGYHRLYHAQFHYENPGDPVVDITILSYPDKAARDAGHQPMDIQKMRIDAPGAAEPSRSDLYTAVKAVTNHTRGGDMSPVDWTDATDHLST